MSVSVTTIDLKFNDVSVTNDDNVTNEDSVTKCFYSFKSYLKNKGFLIKEGVQKNVGGNNWNLSKQTIVREKKFEKE
jgi:hypothetical protein